MRAILVALSVFLLAVTAFGHGAEHTRTYVNAADTQISLEDWDVPPQHTVNYGQGDTLQVVRNDRFSILIRFDLSAIPPNSRIESVRLVLVSTTNTTAVRRIGAYRVLKA